ncbi:hypothetical protein P170DRAFT_463126 [Aspergillus steynii IBT 23096]|uniref:Uncharacterized protein n=1 Tax=Aspergillus steynii IBT 23096 TaxID=1392250 RepID=A0A2I2GKN4_9EURO|nr:uncharacterized protein P170DRAFT_463126 [Aspergillus steynii IBT 23096]PLB53438.1 hypothetical protein P170DRAFT_463126 [Aspergillus steynii IBT 23096]
MSPSTFDLQKCTHLIIVCCHAIYIGGPTKGISEDEWLIEPFQKGETPTFTAHVKAGIQAAAEDLRSVLVFSGGATKRSLTSLAEGESYLNLAKDNALFTFSDKLHASQITTETNATDSYQNVLFSLLKFKTHTGRYPTRVTVVTHEFKRKRFMECHFPAVGLGPVSSPAGAGDQGGDRTSRCKCKGDVIGINPPEEVTSSASLIAGEEKRGIGLWREDRYGVQAELAGKRAQRGWTAGMERDVFGDMGLEAVVEELVCWDGGEDGNKWFSKMERLPWYSADE